MQQTLLNILKKYFNVVKALADFFFCLVGYIGPKSIKDDAVLAMINSRAERVKEKLYPLVSRKMTILCCCFFLFLFLSKENAVLYYYYYYYYYRQRIKKK